MWRTPEGNRVLKGAEAILFQRGLAELVFWIGFYDGDDNSTTGVRVFDALIRPQKLAVLEQVARALLVKNVACPPLTAVAEGTIGAVYYQVLDYIDVEIDEGRLDVRRLTRAACKERRLKRDLPNLKSVDTEAWRDAVESLMDQVLWDRDWEEEFIKPDDHPDLAQTVRQFARIDPDYYTAVPPDPTPRQLERIEKSLRRLLNKKV